MGRPSVQRRNNDASITEYGVVREVSTNAVMGTNRRRRHRSWPESLKREIVAGSLVPGASVSRVARRYDVNANQVFTLWPRRTGTVRRQPAQLRLLPVNSDAGSSEGDGTGRRERGDRDRVGRRLSPAGWRGFQATTLRLVLDVLEPLTIRVSSGVRDGPRLAGPTCAKV